MRTLVLGLSLSLLLQSPTALAQDSEAQAEFDRISAQMNKLAARNTWSGVERQYQLLLATGLPLSAEDHLNGAEAARNLGNAAQAYERLLKANQLESSEAIIDYLWEIDNHYGEVKLVAEPGVALEIEQVPFASTQAAAVNFARESLVESGTFSGRLPKGSYTLGGKAFEVVPLGQPVSLNLLEAERSIASKQKGRAQQPSNERPPPAQPIDISVDDAPSAPVRSASPDSSSAPTLVGLGVGAGSPYGLFGLSAALRPTARQAIQFGVGYDPLGSGAGWSVAGRQRLGEPGLFYAELGYGALDFRKDAAPGAGPFLAGGMELARRGLLIDGTFGVGTTKSEAGDRVFRPLFGLAVGGNFGPNR